MKLLFRHRMFLGVAAIQIVTMAVLVGALHRMMLSEQSEQVHRRAATVVNLVATMVQDAVEVDDVLRIQRMLDQVSSSPDIAYVHVRIDGTPVAHFGVAKGDLRERKVDGSLADVDDGIFDTQRVLPARAKESATVEVGVDVQKFVEPVETTLIRAAALALIAVAVSSALAAVLAAYLTRQINLLREAANKVARGDFDATVPVVGRDELAATAKAFNRMAQHVREVYGNLQQAIAERTEELRLQKERAELLSMTDELTGLMNRRAVLSSAQIELAQARRSGQPLAICMLDIDHFKRVNDTYGHPAGDTVIRTFAKIIRESTREADIVGRIGGEEFLLVMAATSAEDAGVVLERIRSAVEKATIFHEASEIRCTTSGGCAVFSGSESLEALVARADACLYRAKNDGRNRVIV